MEFTPASSFGFSMYRVYSYIFSCPFSFKAQQTSIVWVALRILLILASLPNYKPVLPGARQTSATLSTHSPHLLKGLTNHRCLMHHKEFTPVVSITLSALPPSSVFLRLHRPLYFWGLMNLCTPSHRLDLTPMSWSSRPSLPFHFTGRFSLRLNEPRHAHCMDLTPLSYSSTDAYTRGSTVQLIALQASLANKVLLQELY